MRYLVLSDIHANAVAFEAVLKHAALRRWDRALFLGDIVGYYPQAERCVTLLRELDPVHCILGNHDDLLLDTIDGGGGDHREEGLVKEIISQHVEDLSAESVAFLRSFESHVVAERWEAVHGGLRERWEYLATLNNAQGNAELMSTSLCLVGHTHVPRIFAVVEGPKGEMWRTVPFRSTKSSYRVPTRARVFFNPGSVGQPRDGIPLASYAIFDDDSGALDHFRVEYDLIAMQRLVKSAGYPEVLATRLAVGK